MAPGPAAAARPAPEGWGAAAAAGLRGPPRFRLQPQRPATAAGSPAPLNKHAYFLAHRADALTAWAGGTPGLFADETPLLRELRVVYDWMAERKNVTRISCRHFKQRVPEVHAKFPQLSTSFLQMDTNKDRWLTWEEFVTFCLQDVQLRRRLERALCVTVFGVDAVGARAHKDGLDPAHACELGVAPPLLPWEVAHVVEWRPPGLRLPRRGSPASFGAMALRPGSSIASPPFRAAGVCGFLRLWPAGYWNENQKRKLAVEPPGGGAGPGSRADADDAGLRRPEPWPAFDSECCVGLCAPAGTHLVLRFFVGGARSAQREHFWSEGLHASQLWARPAGREASPPRVWADRTGPTAGDEGPLVVGVEILRNLGREHGKPKPTHPRSLDVLSRGRQRPAMRRPPGACAEAPAESVLLGRSRSLPSVAPATQEHGTSPEAHRPATAGF